MIFIFFAAITNPKAPPGTKDAIKSFNYDYSYFSMDVSLKKIILFTLRKNYV